MKQNKKPTDIFGELGKIFEDAAKPYPQFLTEKSAAPSSNTGETETIHKKQPQILADFIKAIREEFKDENWDYLDFVADRILPDENAQAYTGEGLGITPGKWVLSSYCVRDEDGNLIAELDQNHINAETSEANAKAICLSVNETIGKGYNPAAMGELVEALEIITSSPEWIKQYGGGAVDKKAKTALLKSKLNTLS